MGIHPLMTSRDEFNQKLQDLQGYIEAWTRDRAELKEQLADMTSTFTDREAEWTERIDSLDADIETQGGS
jgi:DNA repair exonuclease SbcCD ATPase subunit